MSDQSPDQNPEQSLDRSPEQSAHSDWHLLLCKPNQNHIALPYLARQDLELFMPEHITQTRWRGRLREVQRPLFAGYVFFSPGAAGAQWAKIRATPGVSQIVGFGDQGPAFVPRGIVEALRQRCDSSGLLQPPEALKAGDDIRITSGPFKEFVSRIEQIDAQKRVHVLLELLGAHTKVVLDPQRVVRTS